MDRLLKAKTPRPDTPIFRSKKRFADAMEMATQSPIAIKLMQKAAKQGENLLGKVIGSKRKATRGAPLQTVPQCSPIFEYRAGKRKRTSSGRKSPSSASPRLSPEKKKKRGLIKRAQRRATLYGKTALQIAHAVRKNPPRLTTSLLCGYYTAEFKLTPTKYAAIEQAVKEQSPLKKKQIRQKTPSPKKQKALAILGIDEKPTATAAPADDYPKVVANEGLLFPFQYFNPAHNEGTAMMHAVPAEHVFKPGPDIRYAQMIDELKENFGEK
ncbi:Oidioi.mRNA.OKI2018_I69.PAR.g12087.t1.cds [Oikopleura dioica]|uniref:Oidioi.mRNA.OKI2018_I69.PAR.g12087.t1.cds n=1 Tax=Oikopleura dioica TaxID=34765 RepID=A0ABN7S449_OIKDI|nr:Oidioi.mRNA.OKI2018_I69.PAR.g12087.t1.cds [Oikopleura dioica]